MNIVIDPGVIPCTFEASNSRFEAYKHVLEKIQKRKVKFVIGGSLYKTQLGKLSSYIRLLNQFSTAGMAIKLEDEAVDGEQERVVERCIKSKTCKDQTFDDPHLIALAIIGSCKVICTDDARSHIFIKSKELYPKDCSIPKIYNDARHVSLLPA